MEPEDDPFAEPDEDIYELELPTELPVPHSALFDLFLFISNAREEDENSMSMIRHYLNELYDEYANEFPERDSETLASDIMNYLARRHKWEVELLWDKKETEEMLFRRYNTYDPHIWDKVQETKAVRDLHRAVYEVSQEYLRRALEEVVNPHARINKKQGWSPRRKRRD